MATLDIPHKVRVTAEQQGAEGLAWIAGLPEQIARIERDWCISIGEPAKKGTEAYVAFARDAEGRDCAVKFVISGRDPKRQELRTLLTASGKGYAKLIRADEEANVLLLERLGPQLHELNYSEEDKIAAICGTLQNAWQVPVPPGPPFATGADRARELRAIVEKWSALGQPCSERTFDLAMRLAAKREAAFDPDTSVLVHGDGHEWNTLAVPGGGFKFVDPDGAVAERAFDLAIPMREWNEVPPRADIIPLARRRCELLTTFTGVDPEPIWEWSLLQLVSNGMLWKKAGVDALASIPLTIADLWAEAWGEL